MYKLRLLNVLCAASFAFQAKAQMVSLPSGNVGIGTLTPSHQLHTTGSVRFQTLTGTNSRLLQTDATGILAPVSGGVTGQVLTQGATGLTWATLPTPLTGWSLTGNAAPIGSFLGTTNAIPLQFKVNNINAGLLSTANTFMGYQAGLVNTGSANSFLGVNAGFSNTTGSNNAFTGTQAGFKNTTGLNNVFTGVNAGYNNTTASQNSFYGMMAGFNNTVGGNNAFFGYQAGAANTTGSANTFVGSSTGGANTVGGNNTFVGWAAGPANTTGEYNTFIGRSAGNANTTATYNTFVGGLVGRNNTTGPGNTFIGFGAGNNNVAGGNNVITGWGAGATLNAWGNSIYGSRAGAEAVGDGNVLIGQAAGLKAGSGNVMIGTGAGENAVAANNQLYIANSNTLNPLIYGDFATSQLKLHGKVAIGGNSMTGFGTIPTTAGGVSVSAYNLFVKGGILTDEVRVALNGTWADYVFAKEYKLPTLQAVEAFIAQNKHLPNVPSAEEVKAQGINVGDMARIQQEKIEELTLYLIDQNKRIEKLETALQLLTAKK